MSIAQSMLPEFDQEMASTRRTLERVPGERFDWRPHEKSYTLGELTTHLANLVTWGSMSIEQDSYDMTPKDGESPRTRAVASVAEAVKKFDENVAATRAALAGASDETLMSPWSLVMNGEALFTMPRVAVMRSFVMNHMIHHRAQLCVYLRLNDVPVPSIYGPSADESGMQ
ncbi:MAG TPA: DUF664 domain-containing protein [Chromatiales bacterium]|nr:DUF664 domain-containing protein [Chromatiales bacterium]